MSLELHGALPQTRHLIDDESTIGEARRHAVALAQNYGFDATAAGRVAIVATELATNLIRHGGGGELLIQPVGFADQVLIELLAIDRGPGMESVDRCLADGFSTGGTAGTGLGAVRRLSMEFDIHSVAGEGTVVLARIACDARRGAPGGVRLGAISVPVSGEIECGDSWRVATQGDSAAIMVVDGLGHGALAAAAARMATTAFESAPFDAPYEVLQRAHRAAAGSRGAAGACASVPKDGVVRYAGVGNISGFLLSGQKSQGLVSHGGTLGVKLPRVQQFEYQRGAHTLMIMHSDGISARWDLRSKPGLLQRHPAIVAAILYRDHARRHDDSTVVVMG